MDSFSGKLAVVTGGGSGMGRELVRQLAAQGCSVAACDVNADAVARRGLGLRSEPDQVDAELIDRLLTDPGLGRAASEVADEIATLPRPADLVPKIAGLA